MSDPVLRLVESAPEDVSAVVIYGPEEIRLMRKALDASWSALAFAHFDNDSDKRATREELARRILKEAAQGERSVPVLSGRALGALEPRSARGSQWQASRYAS